jgi:hypothetical protein
MTNEEWIYKAQQELHKTMKEMWLSQSQLTVDKIVTKKLKQALREAQNK